MLNGSFNFKDGQLLRPNIFFVLLIWPTLYKIISTGCFDESGTCCGNLKNFDDVKFAYWFARKEELMYLWIFGGMRAVVLAISYPDTLPVHLIFLLSFLHLPCWWLSRFLYLFRFDDIVHAYNLTSRVSLLSPISKKNMTSPASS